MSGQRMEEVVPVLIRRREEITGGAKKKTLPLQERDVRPSEKTLEPAAAAAAPKVRRKRGELAEDGADGRRRRKPKAIVEVKSTFTELRRLLQEMRPSTLQVLKTPYYRNCKAARNMRKGVRQIRDFCKQVRLETVMLAKKKQGEEMSRKRRKPEAATPPPEGGEEVLKKKKKVSPPPDEDEVSRKKKKPETMAGSLEEGEEVSRARKKPEVATPPLEDTADDGTRGEVEVETPDVTLDDESTRELEVATPPLDASLDDENE
ncbi:unnamed protein product [Calypogeia fissa]